MPINTGFPADEKNRSHSTRLSKTERALALNGHLSTDHVPNFATPAAPRCMPDLSIPPHYAPKKQKAPPGRTPGELDRNEFTLA
jgi:hypothetical protein